MGFLRPAAAAATAALLILIPPTTAQSSGLGRQIAELCRLVAVPGDAFTFVPPPPEPQVSGLARSAVVTPQINVTYVGFDAFPAAQAAFQHAVDIWAGLISTPVPINVRAEFKVLSSGVLGSAGATYIRDFPGAALPSTYYPYPLADRMRGSDNAPGSFDIQSNFNSSFPNWYFGTDGVPPSGHYDFVSVVLHELGHGFGFSGYASVSSGVGSIGASGYPFIYDRFTVSESGVPLLSFANPSAALGTQLTQPYNPASPRGPGVYWGGANGVAGNGGLTARLYTASTWSGGSSYSHLDDSTYPAGNPNSLMTHALSGAEAIHHPGPVTLGLFTDMGWSISTAAPGTTRDFNSDDTPDLIFENGAGQQYAWFMNGTTFIGGGFFSPSPIDANLRVVGVNDFTGDGKPDVLYQHQGNKTVTLHKMDGLTKTAEQPIQTATNTPWTVVATGDLNNDDSPDIVWQNVSTGQVYVWFMAASGGNAGFAGVGGAFSGNFIRDGGGTIVSMSPATQRIVGAADMNNDGHDDLIWHDPTTGLLRVWQLMGNTRTADTAVTPAGTSTAWKLRAVEDYNSDGRADFVWQHGTTGDLYVWFMNGTTYASGAYVTPSHVNPAWTIAGPR